MEREVLAAASPAGWPPPQHGAAARLRRAAAPQNTTDSHSETLCIELVLAHIHPHGCYKSTYPFSHVLHRIPPPNQPAPKPPLFLAHLLLSA